MAKTKIEKLGSAKRFGARYGTKTKHQFAKIEKEQRKKHKCPYCNNLKVKRIAVGIWQCRKCNSKFTGKAYSIAKAIGFEEVAEKEKNLEISPKTDLEESPSNQVKTDSEEMQGNEHFDKKQRPLDKTEEVA